MIKTFTLSDYEKDLLINSLCHKETLMQMMWNEVFTDRPEMMHLIHRVNGSLTFDHTDIEKIADLLLTTKP